MDKLTKATVTVALKKVQWLTKAISIHILLCTISILLYKRKIKKIKLFYLNIKQSLAFKQIYNNK